MNDFTFSVPQNIMVGRGSLAKLPEAARQLGGSHAFIISGPHLTKMGLVGKVSDSLAAAGFAVDAFTETEGNPSTDTVEKASAAYKASGADFIVAFGGGSPMDVAKAVGVVAKYGGRIEEYEGAHKVPGKIVPLIAIPTTAGTGSEVTDYAVITDRAKGIKYPLDSQALRPPVAILDPELTVSAPASVTADAGMDVLTHALEAYVSKGANDFSDALCEKAVSLVFRFLPLAFQDGTNLLAREKMHNASCMAGLAFNSAGLGLNHGMAHAIGAKLHIAHGRINAMLLPHIITFNADLGRIRNGEYALAAKKYQRMAKVLDLPAPSVRLGVTNLLREVERLNRTLKIPASLKEWGAEPSKVKELRGEIVSAALADATTATNPRPAAAEHVEALLNKVMGG